jgi:hypothetical protein
MSLRVSRQEPAFPFQGITGRLAIGGVGSELRRPLGIAIVGGLIVSQALTLFTTPVIYLYMDGLSAWSVGARARLLRILHRAPAPAAVPAHPGSARTAPPM